MALAADRARGLEVLGSEILWVWLPLAGVSGAFWLVRRLRALNAREPRQG